MELLSLPLVLRIMKWQGLKTLSFHYPSVMFVWTM